MIAIKNDEIEKLLDRLKKESESHLQDTNEKQEEINMLR